VVLCIYFTSQANTFLTLGNFRETAINSSILGVVVVASTMLVIAGYVDLSIGSVIGLSGVITSLCVLQWNVPPVIAMLLGVLTGAVVGVVNGTLCTFLGFSSIIVTLGMLSAIRGITLLTTSTALFGLGPQFAVLGRGEIAHVPVLVLVALATFVIGVAFLTLTPWGRYVYAIGVNPQAAYLAGLPVRGLPFALFVVTGASAGLAGVLFSARLDGAAPAELGLGMELTTLTAILIGGVAFAGGRGSLFGVFFAVLLLGVLQDGLVLMNVSSFIQLVAQGGVLVLAAALDRFGSLISSQQNVQGRAWRGLWRLAHREQIIHEARTETASPVGVVEVTDRLQEE
jgi:ribose/xylose/arabinose/galactoside ABC-type transport system permease subunit